MSELKPSYHPNTRTRQAELLYLISLVAEEPVAPQILTPIIEPLKASGPGPIFWKPKNVDVDTELELQGYTPSVLANVVSVVITFSDSLDLAYLFRSDREVRPAEKLVYFSTGPDQLRSRTNFSTGPDQLRSLLPYNSLL